MAEYKQQEDHVPADARIETLAIHGGQHPDPVTGAVMPAISQPPVRPGRHRTPSWVESR